jgi:two-component system NtrC family sensor kinase
VTTGVGLDKRARAERVSFSLGTLFESTRVPVIVVDEDGAFVAANDAAIFHYGYSLDEFLAMRVHDIQASSRPLDLDLGAALRGDPGALERRQHKRKDGSLLWIVPTVSPIEVDGERYIVSVLANITSAVAAEERVRQDEERAVQSRLMTTDRLAAIGRLAAGVAHEVNNPAGFVTLALQLVREQIAVGRTPPADSVRVLDEALSAMLQISEIMRDLTGFARERARSLTDLTAVANSAIRIASVETRERARVDRDFADDIFADVRGARIAQVVLNLLINAAQSIPLGGAQRNRIVVRVFRDGDQACIEVTDTGPGVPTPLRDKIFEPFFTTRAANGGTGLGLWLSRGIVEEERGTLTYSTTSTGGAAFRVSLPRARIEAAREAPRDDAAVSS